MRGVGKQLKPLLIKEKKLGEEDNMGSSTKSRGWGANGLLVEGYKTGMSQHFNVDMRI